MSKKRDWQNLTASELAEATKEFDQEHIADTFRKMTPEEENSWRAATGKLVRNRPQLRNVKKTISLSISAGLLKKADALAKKRGISRARLVAESLETVLANGS